MSGDTLELETVLDLCGDRHRRVVLAVLASEQRPRSLDELAGAVEEHAVEEPETAASSGDRKQVRISLHHVHLPKLAEAGLVDYDPEQRVVDPTERLDGVRRRLSDLAESDLFEADLESEAPLER